MTYRNKGKFKNRDAPVCYWIGLFRVIHMGLSVDVCNLQCLNYRIFYTVEKLAIESGYFGLSTLMLTFRYLNYHNQIDEGHSCVQRFCLILIMFCFSSTSCLRISDPVLSHNVHYRTDTKSDKNHNSQYCNVQHQDENGLFHS